MIIAEKKLLEKLEGIFPFIGNTPTCQLNMEKFNLFAKLEYYNFTGSIKDRPAYNIIIEAILNGDITEDTTVIESSSGNLALSLATICAKMNIKFIAVIDPIINNSYENLLKLICYKVLKVSEIDENGGFLLTRLRLVKSLCKDNPKLYWTNQYQNPNNFMSYLNGLGNEICNYFEKLDYIFVGVSTGGTVTGLSQRLKEQFPYIKVVAIDVIGSVIFGGKPEKRYIPGIGASISSPILKQALIDDIVYVSQLEIVDGCEELLKQHSLFVGASSGAVYMGVKKYFSNKELFFKPNILFLCTDKGSAYLDNIYNPIWKKTLIEKLK